MEKAVAGSCNSSRTRFKRILVAVAIVITTVWSANAVRYTVRIEELQPAQQVEGVVLDPSGAPIWGMTVTDRTENWEAVLRTTKTDEKGRFHFSRQSGKSIYHLFFYHQSFNELELRLKLDKHATQKGIIVRPEIGG